MSSSDSNLGSFLRWERLFPEETHGGKVPSSFIGSVVRITALISTLIGTDNYPQIGVAFELLDIKASVFAYTEAVWTSGEDGGKVVVTESNWCVNISHLYEDFGCSAKKIKAYRRIYGRSLCERRKFLDCEICWLNVTCMVGEYRTNHRKSWELCWMEPV